MTDFIYLFILNQGLSLQWILLVASCILGFVLLVKCADIFVDSASNLAKIFKIPAIVIGLTIVAFGTSAPEASVSITATINGSNGISIGNIIGSNLFNLFVVLALSALFSPVQIKRYLVKRDLLVMLVSSLMLTLFIFILPSQEQLLTRVEGVLLLILFVAYIFIMISKETKQAKVKMHVISKSYASEEFGKRQKSMIKIFVGLLLSLIGIVVGGTLVNVGAKGLVVKIGASESLAGLTVCSIGTSLPELVTSIVAIRKNENDIAIGNVVGSNIFNLLFILGVCSVISPLAISAFAVWDIIILAVLMTMFFVYSIFNKEVGIKMATAMLTIYIIYFAFIVVREYVPII